MTRLKKLLSSTFDDLEDAVKGNQHIKYTIQTNTGDSLTYAGLFDQWVMNVHIHNSIYFIFVNHKLDNEKRLKINEFTLKLVEFLGKGTEFFITGVERATVYNDKLFIKIWLDENKVTLSVWGDKTECEKIEKQYKNVSDDQSTIYWWYSRPNGGIENIMFYLDEVNLSKDVYYPYIQEGIDSYFKKYLKSNSQILILSGPPGTGKTSLIRSWLKMFHLNAMTTYDSVVMQSDQFYIDFLSDNEMNALIVEDADTLLLSRETKGNEIISKILNASDGIVKLSDKKIIFTTNLEKTNDIDHALLRPGRCYDFLECRNLTFDEAVNVAAAENISLTKSKKYYSLADIFNQDQNVKLAQKIGF